MNPGDQLGPYEIIEPLGAGGMGEVYRARDPRLDRDVAIKVLPEDFAADAERLARFEREAKLLAQLNHANIASIYGLEDEGEQRFIVMEVVEGETLAERIASSGRIEVDEALDIARQIAEALEAAHENGVIHRDLKPANVIVTPDGNAKVLDFGLAKAYEADGSSPDVSPDLSHSPTMMEVTRTGVILGTAAYMSPEQAKGKRVDKRTDIWAFGCVLYEMLADKRTFDGETVADTMAAILRAAPHWDMLPDGLHPAIVGLLRRCLDKDPRQRLRDIGEARVLLDRHASGADLGQPTTGVDGDVGVGKAGLASLRALPVVAKALLVAVAAALAALAYLVGARFGATGVSAAADAIRHLPISGPAESPFGYGPRPFLAISRDARRIAYVTSPGLEGRFGGQLWVQDLATSAPPRAIAGADDAETPFFSPDGESIAFVAGGKVLRSVSLTGNEPPVDLAPAVTGPGGVWADDGSIFFFSDYFGPLQRVSPDGTIEEVLEAAPDVDLSHPALLPGGERLLVTRWESGTEVGLVSVSLATGATTTVIERGFYGRYVPTGHILYIRGTELVAVRYDEATGAVGRPTVLTPDLAVNYTERKAEYAVADDGTLVYLAAEPGGRWLNRLRPGQAPERLNVEPLAPPGYYDKVDISPNGDLLTMLREDSNIWLFDLVRNQMSARLTRPPGSYWQASWNGDGQRVVFNSMQSGQWGFWEISIEPGATPVLILETPENKWPYNRAPDGTLAYVRAVEGGGVDVYLLPSESGEPQPFLDTPDRENAPQFSPDGRWMAYENDNTGTLEIYVTSYPDRARTRRISLAGGNSPVFQADGSAIFYRNADTVYRVQVLDRANMQFSEPEPFVRGVDRFAWDVMPDGSAVIALERRKTPELRLVLGAAALFDAPGSDSESR